MIVKELLENSLLDAEADEMVGATRYARSPDRQDYRSGHYNRKLHTKAGEVELKVPKLRKQTFETQRARYPATVSSWNERRYSRYRRRGSPASPERTRRNGR